MQTATFDQMTAEGVAFLSKLNLGEPVTITHDGEAVALLVGVAATGTAPRPLGCYSGQIKVSADFNDPLTEWDEALGAPLGK